MYEYIYILLRILARPACDRPRNSNRDASPTGTDNSVVTLLGLPPETSHGWGFNLTTTQSAFYPCEYLGISTFGDLPYLARGECGLDGGEVKPPPVTSSW